LSWEELEQYPLMLHTGHCLGKLHRDVLRLQRRIEEVYHQVFACKSINRELRFSLESPWNTSHTKNDASQPPL
jgi:hypothetical protein